MKKLTGCSYDDRGRKYHFDDGSAYYSVTTMLGNTADKSYLEEWRNRIGRQKAEHITKTAGIIGTDMHKCLEDYMLKRSPQFPNSVIKNLFKQIKPFVDKNVSNVHASEMVLYSDSLQLAGTADGIVDFMINGVPEFSILDFKTANRRPRVEWISDYFLQMTAYAMMYEEMYGKFPKYGVLLFAYKKVRSPHRQIICYTEKYKSHVIERNQNFLLTLGR